MKYVFIVIAVLAILIAAFFTFAPESRINAAKTEWARMSGDIGQLCFDQWSDNLKDPSSAQIIDSYTLGDRAYVKYRAKNSFGTYLEGKFECPIKDGQIDDAALLTEQNEMLLNR